MSGSAMEPLMVADRTLSLARLPRAGIAASDDRIGFELDEPARVDELLHRQRRVRGADVGEDLPVRPPDFFEVVGTDEVDTRPDDVRERGARLRERGLDDLQAP